MNVTGWRLGLVQAYFGRLIKGIKNIGPKHANVFACPTIIFSERGFLPGEKVTIRAKPELATHVDTISFYPIPLILKDSFGNKLMHAELVDLNPTVYELKISYTNYNRLVKIVSYYEDQKKEENIIKK